MFAYIKGTVEDISNDTIVVENNGLGFQIMTSATDIGSILLHDYVTIYTYLNVREDDMSLFGFISKDELSCFKLLIGISGIGPKGALAILSALSLDDLRMAVISEDYKAIAKANGIGPKTAQRVIIELKDKIKLEDISYVNDDVQSSSNGVTSSNETLSETVQALVSLGYSNSEAMRAVRKVKNSDELTTEELLKQALKNMM